MPMIPMGDPAAGMDPAAMSAPAGPVPADPTMGGDPMMDQPEPSPEEIAQVLGAQLEQDRQMAHQMIDQEADARLQTVMAMIAGAGHGAQVMGPGSIA